MSNRASVKLQWSDSRISLLNKDAVKGLFKMGYDIASQARTNAPYVTGALRSTIRVQEADDNTIEVVAGGSYGGRVVDYAWKREQGPNRDSSTEHYMENAANTIMTGDYIKKYFGDII